MSESGMGDFFEGVEFDRNLDPEAATKAVAGYLKARDMVGVRRGLGVVRNVQQDEYYLKLARDFVEMNKRASNDALTGLFTRRSLDQYLARELVNRRKSSDTTPFTLVFLDMDDFGKVNKEEPDQHQAGDRALAMLGSTISEKIAQLEASQGISGKGFRYGGEEIVLVFNGSEDKVLKFVKELGKEIKDKGASKAGLIKRGQLTVSAGISSIADGDIAQTLVQRANELESQVKKKGKNGVGRYESGKVKIDKF